MAYIDQLKKKYPHLSHFTDHEIVDRLSQATGASREQVYADLGIEPPDEPGFISAFQAGLGRTVEGLGDVFGSESLERFGRQVQQQNPQAVTDFESFAKNPWLGIREITGQAASFLTVPLALRGIGGGLRLLSGVRGLGALSPASKVVTSAPVEMAAYGLPSLPDIQRSQEEAGVYDPLVKYLGAFTVGAIERLGGPQRFLRPGGLAGLASEYASTPLRTLGKTVSRSSLEEAGEELIQNPIEQLAGYRNPLTPESLKETAFGGFAGAIGGAALAAPVGAYRAFRQPIETIGDKLSRGEQADLLKPSQETVEIPTLNQEVIEAPAQVRTPDVEEGQFQFIINPYDVGKYVSALQQGKEYSIGSPQLGLFGGGPLEVPSISRQELSTPRQESPIEVARRTWIETQIGDKPGSKGVWTRLVSKHGLAKLTAEELPQRLIEIADNGTHPQAERLHAVADALANYFNVPLVKQTSTSFSGELPAPASTGGRAFSFELTPEMREFLERFRNAPELHRKVIFLRLGVDEDFNQVDQPLSLEKIGKQVKNKKGKPLSKQAVSNILQKYGITDEVVTRFTRTDLPEVAPGDLAPSVSEEGEEPTGFHVVATPTSDFIELSKRDLAAQQQTEKFLREHGEDNLDDLTEVPDDYAPVRTQRAGEERKRFLKEVAEDYDSELPPGALQFDQLPDEAKQKYIDAFSDHREGQLSARGLMEVYEELTNEYKQTTPESGEPRFGEAKPKATNARSAQELRENLVRLFLTPKRFDQLVTIVDTIEGLPNELRAAAQRINEEGRLAQGVTYRGRVYLVADQIEAGEEVSVLLHELGVHLGMPSEEVSRLAQQVREWAAKNDNSLESRLSRRALARARLSSSGEKAVTEETVAYFVTEAVDAGIDPTAAKQGSPSLRDWFRRLVDAIKALLRKIGFRDPNELTAQHIVDYAYGFARLSLETGNPAKGKGVMFSDSRVESRSLRDDTTAQIDWLEAQAKERGYESVDQLASRDPQAFEQLAAQWRKEHPAAALFAERDFVAESKRTLTNYGRSLTIFSKDTWNKIKPTLLTLHQLVDRYGDRLPSLKNYVLKMTEMESRQFELEQKALNVVIEWQRLKRPVRNALNQLALDATLSEIHPDKEFRSEENAHLRPEHYRDYRKWFELNRRYQALPDEAKKVYQNARKTLDEFWKIRKEGYAGVVNKVYSKLIASAKKAGKTKRVEELIKEQNEILKEHEERLKEIKGPYFPLVRFGDYIVVAESKELIDAKTRLENATGKEHAELKKQIASMEKNPAHYVVEAFTNLAAAENRKRVLENKNMIVQPVKKADAFVPEMRPMTHRLLTQLDDDLNATFDAQTAHQVRELLAAAYVNSLPENASLARQLKRKGVYGASSDMLRAFATVTQRDAFYLSRMEFSDDLTDALYKVKKDADESGVELKHVYNDLTKRIALDLQYKPTPIQDILTRTSYIYHLGVSPAFLLTNMSQVPMISLPVLAGRYTFSRSAKALTTAWGDAAKLVVAANKRGVFAPISFDALPKNEQALLETLNKRGAINITIEIDLGAAAEAMNPKLAEAKKWLGWANHNIELVNRISTALATYRLAKANGANENTAIEEAYKTVIDTQVDYSNANAAYWMKRGALPFGKLMFQFRKYQQAMIYLLARNVQLLKDPAQRSEAARTLFYMFTMQGLMAGGLGLPIAFPLLALANMFIPDDDKEGDAETRFRNYVADTFGPEVGRVIAKGIPTIFGVDLSKRIGMGDIFHPMPFLRADRAQTGEETVGAFLTAVAGPAVSMVARMVDGAKLMEQGDWRKGVEKMVPKFLADFGRAARYSREGLTTRRGLPVLPAEQFDAWDLVFRMLGFSPVIESEHYAAKQAKENIAHAITERRNRLLKAYALARLKGENTRNIENEIAKFNRDHPEIGMRIDRSSLLRAVQSRKKAMEELDEVGVSIPKNQRSLGAVTRFAN